MNRDMVFYTATMAKVHVDQGNLEKAAEIYRYLLEREPDRQDLRDALFAIEKDRLEKRDKKLGHLVPLLGKWIDLALQYNRFQQLKKLRNFFDGN